MGANLVFSLGFILGFFLGGCIIILGFLFTQKRLEAKEDRDFQAEQEALSARRKAAQSELLAVVFEARQSLKALEEIPPTKPLTRN